jgi:hypothetical protein
MGFFLHDVYELFEKADLKLTDHEIALLNSILILNPRRAHLSDPSKVSDLQATALHVLYRHLKLKRPGKADRRRQRPASNNTINFYVFVQGEPDLFRNLLRLVPLIQSLNVKHMDALNKLQMNAQ